MTVFLYTLKRMLKNKVMLAIMILLPLVAIIPGTSAVSNSVGITVGVVNQDGTPFTEDLIQRLGKNFTIVNTSLKDADSDIENAHITYAIVIPKGFTNDIISGKSPKINGYGSAEKDCSKGVGAAIYGFIYPSKLIAAQVHGNSTAFYAAVSKIPATKAVAQKKDNKAPFGLIIQFIFMSSIYAATVIIADKESKTFYRSFTTPVSMRGYMLQSVLCFFILSLLQLAILFGIVVYGLGVYPGKNPADMLALLAVVALSSVALGIAVSSMCKSTVQAVAIGLGIVVVMCMFGGAWGMTPTSPILLGFSKALPYYWSVDAVDKLVNNKVFVSIGSDVLVLLAFTAVFFLVGTWRKSDIER
jgi:ABC-2 type transport system permease protein